MFYFFVVIAALAVFWGSHFLRLAPVGYYTNTNDRFPSLGSGEMFNNIAPFYDIANKVMSLGLDKLWRRRLVAMADINHKDKVIVDLATGTGDVAILMAESIQERSIVGSSILGIDPSANMLDRARRKVQKYALDHLVILSLGDGQSLQLKSSSVDLVTMSFGIRNILDRRKVLGEIHRILNHKRGARVLIMEFVNPRKGMLAPVASFFISYVIPLLGLVTSAGHAVEYKHLADSIIKFPTPDEFLVEMKSSGFNRCDATDIFFDIIHIFKCVFE